MAVASSSLFKSGGVKRESTATNAVVVMEEEGDPFLPGGVLYSLQLLTQQLLPPLTRNCVSKGQVKGASTPVLKKEEHTGYMHNGSFGLCFSK